MNNAQFPSQFTHIGRTLDPRIPSIRLVLILAALAAVGMALYRISTGLLLQEVGLQAVATGVFVVLAWAAARELDPDHNRSAYIAAGLMVAALLAWPLPNLLLTMTAIAAIRVVNRTTGLPALPTDALGIIALVGVITALDGLWVIGLVAALAFLLNALLPPPDYPNSLIYAGLSLVVTAVVSWFLGAIPLSLHIEPGLGGTAMLVGLAFLTVILREPPTLQSVGDWTGEPLDRRRVLAGQMLALAAVAAVLLEVKFAGLVALSPLWVALVGVIIRRVL
jgi:hypothetical protein